MDVGVIPDEHEHESLTAFALDLRLDAGIYSADADSVHIEVYNSLIPEPGELSATLLLEIEDQAICAQSC